jgi:signal transduction histidine kinase
MDSSYSPQYRAERVIAAGRVVLAAFSLLAFWLDPAEPSKYAHIAYALLAFYLGYGLSIAWLVWRAYVPIGHLPIITHVFDLVIFSVFAYFTEGATSPFFMYVVFSLICATLRWQWRGTLWTASAALGTFIGLGIYAAEVLHDPAFELNRFIIRSVYLSVMAMFLGYLGAHEHRLRNELSRLAAWPTAVPPEAHALVQELLEHASRLLGVSRLLMAWEEPEEPWLHVVLWASGICTWTREPPGTYQPLVSESLAGTSFLCRHCGSSMPVVLYTAPTGVERWQGVPLNLDFRSRFAINTALSLHLGGESLEGYLFALGKPAMTADDLVLGEIVARQVVARMEQFYLSQQLRQAAVSEERLRLARDLHDGLLQSMGAAALQMKTIRRLLEGNLQAARERLREVQRLLVTEQRDLRSFIEGLTPGLRSPPEAAFDLAARLAQLQERIERHWRLRIELQGALPEEQNVAYLASHIYFIIHEALINIARHAHASMASVELQKHGDQVHITVTDNGRGFPFRGHFDHTALTEMKLGPVMLKDRIGSLRGTVAINSTDAGSRLEIMLPVAQPGV